MCIHNIYYTCKLITIGCDLGNKKNYFVLSYLVLVKYENCVNMSIIHNIQDDQNLSKK